MKTEHVAVKRGQVSHEGPDVHGAGLTPRSPRISAGGAQAAHGAARIGSRRMKTHIWVVAGLLLASGLAQAAEVRGRFTTIVIGREDPRGSPDIDERPSWEEGESNVPIYELFGFELRELELPGMDATRIVLNGWGRLQLGESEIDDHDADLRLLYVDSRSGPFVIRLGRQHTTLGVGRMDLIDGVYAGVDLDAGFTASGFFGATVDPRFDYDRGDWQGGGRLAWRWTGPGEVGLAYAHRRRGGEIFREELALDSFYWVGPTRWVGLAALSPRDGRLVEGRIAGTVWPVDEVAVTVDFEHTAPDLFIPRDSIFSVFAETSHESIGTDVAWALSPYYELATGFRAILLEGEWLGYEVELGGTAYREPTHRSLVGLELRRHSEDENSYSRARALTALQVVDGVKVAAEAFGYYYDEPINGEDGSLLGQASLVYDLGPSMRLAGTLASGFTPFSNFQLEGLVRFEYGLGMDLSREWGP